jgi:hypothetical protein
MSKDYEDSAPYPINVQGLQELKLLETELLSREAQLRNFTPLRDRLVARGQDANVAYRKIQSRRDSLAAQVKKLSPPPPPFPATAIGPRRPGTSVLSIPIAPARIMPGGSPWFGTSGSVHVGRAQEGVNVVPHGKLPSSGTITSPARSFDGVIEFAGVLDVSFDAETGSSDWNYLFFFPPPAQLSTLTYSFEVDAFAFLSSRASGVTLLSFATIGETANFVGVEHTSGCTMERRRK